MTLEPMESRISSDSYPLDYDLTIVGGGIVGTTLASALKNSGLKILIIEAQPLEIAAARQRAYALSLLSERILTGIGVWDKILPHIGKFSHVHLSDGDYPKVVQFQHQELNGDYLGYVAEHRIMLNALQEFSTDCPHISWLCPVTVEKVDYQTDYAEVTVKIAETVQKIHTKLIIGADGARSPIRQAAGIKTRGWKYWQSCVTFTIKHQAPRNDIAFERFWHTGPMGILPLPGNRCQIVWTAPHLEAKALKELDEAAFLSKLEQRTGGILGKLEMAGDRFLYPVQLMQSDRYIKPRLALIGDAAHCCHPVGGQGLNLGIRDAAVLAQILQEARRQGKDIGEISVLKSYEAWRKQENLTILAFTDLLDRLFSNNFFPIVTLRRLGLSIMGNFFPLKRYTLQLMTGLRGKKPQIVNS